MFIICCLFRVQRISFVACAWHASAWRRNASPCYRVDVKTSAPSQLAKRRLIDPTWTTVEPVYASQSTTLKCLHWKMAVHLRETTEWCLQWRCHHISTSLCNRKLPESLHWSQIVYGVTDKACTRWNVAKDCNITNLELIFCFFESVVMRLEMNSSTCALEMEKCSLLKCFTIC